MAERGHCLSQTIGEDKTIGRFGLLVPHESSVREVWMQAACLGGSGGDSSDRSMRRCTPGLPLARRASCAGDEESGPSEESHHVL